MKNINYIIGILSFVVIIFSMIYLVEQNNDKDKKIEHIKTNFIKGDLIIITKNNFGQYRFEKASNFIYTGESIGIVLDSTKVQIILTK